MTKVFTESIRLSETSIKGFEEAERIANSPIRKKEELARKKRRERINKLRKSA